MEKKKKKVVTATDIRNFMSDMAEKLNWIAHEKEIALQTVESGSEIARLQGFLAGARDYKDLLKKQCFIAGTMDWDSTLIRSEPYFDDGVCTIDGLEELADIVLITDNLVENPEYKRLQEDWNKKVESAKDLLFFSCEKGRELFYYKGWYAAMKMTADTIKALHSELEWKMKEAAEKLPFDKQG